jgi:hypothetical protein
MVRKTPAEKIQKGFRAALVDAANEGNGFFGLGFEFHMDMLTTE